MAYLTPTDLEPFIPNLDDAKAQALIDDATAIAIGAGPCLADDTNLTDNQKAEIKALIRAAIVRHVKSGEQPNKTWEAAGPFSQGFQAQPTSSSMFYRHEMNRFRDLCYEANGMDGGSFTFSIVKPDDEGNP